MSSSLCFIIVIAVWYKRAGEGEIGSVLFRDQVDVPSEGQIKHVKGGLVISN